MVLASNDGFDIEDDGVDRLISNGRIALGFSVFDTVKMLREEMGMCNFVVRLPWPVLSLLLSVSFCKLT